MIFGPCSILPAELAALIRAEVLPLVSRLRARDRSKFGKKAALRGQRARRTKALRLVLRRAAKKRGFLCFPNSDKRLKKKLGQWLYDLIWWEDRSGKKGIELAVESEWNRPVGDIVDDFEKLLAVKSPVKLMVYRVSRNTRERVRKALAESVREYRHHVKDENYILCEFQPDWGCVCLLFRVPKTGSVSNVKFREIFKA